MFVRVYVRVCVEINLKASPSLITPLPVAERAGAGLSEGNVEGVRNRSRDVRLLCERLSLRKKKRKQSAEEKKNVRGC